MKKQKEEILELAWIVNEKGKFTRADVMNSPDSRISTALLDELIKEKFLTEFDGTIKLTTTGEKEARRIIRAHRLSERLFVDVLDLPIKSMENNACTFEHFLNPEVVDSICTLLGHPRECPHGRTIPPGPCCDALRKEIGPVVIPLSELKSGAEAKVAYLVTKQHKRLDQLSSLGLIPGAIITVHQTSPTYVIKVNETDIALDDVILKDIYVRRKNT